MSRFPKNSSWSDHRALLKDRPAGLAKIKPRVEGVFFNFYLGLFENEEGCAATLDELRALRTRPDRDWFHNDVYRWAMAGVPQEEQSQSWRDFKALIKRKLEEDDVTPIRKDESR